MNGSDEIGIAARPSYTRSSARSAYREQVAASAPPQSRYTLLRRALEGTGAERFYLRPIIKPIQNG